MGTPYSFFGLGRTNNYVERLFVGSSLSPPNHITSLEALIPNSQLIINPPYPLLSNETEPPAHRPAEWRSELFLQPGDWVPWVAAAVAGAVFILGFVVLGLRAREQVSSSLRVCQGCVLTFCRKRMRRRGDARYMRSTFRLCDAYALFRIAEAVSKPCSAGNQEQSTMPTACFRSRRPA